jgi:hypothetical protein
MPSSYISGLYKNLEKVEKERAQAEMSAAAEHTPVSMPAKPLERQIVEYFRSISPAQLSRPWTLNEIIMSGNLTGIYRDRPHPQQVGDILRRLSWRRCRLYGAHGGNRYWLPPA